MRPQTYNAFFSLIQSVKVWWEEPTWANTLSMALNAVNFVMAIAGFVAAIVNLAGAIKGLISAGKAFSAPPSKNIDSGGKVSRGAGNIDDIVEQIPNDKPVIVIGETMDRVDDVAQKLRQTGLDVKTYQPRNFRSSPGNLSRLDLEANRSWLRYWTQKKSATVIDVGIDPIRTARSPFYALGCVVNSY